MTYRIPLSYNPIDAQALTAVLQAYNGLHHDQLITGFEKALSAETKSPHVVALNSGTAAIHLGLKALGVTATDEVLVSTFTYIGSINPITYLGATPVFIDSEKETWNMDPVLLEIAIKERLNAGIKPRVILVVHAYGMPANMDAIMAIAQQYEIAVLEDAAEALGSTYKNKHVGTFGHVGILSFNNNKTLTTYGGGAILTNQADIAAKIKFWSTQSRDDKPFYEHSETGYNYRMGPLNAAYGLAGLKNLDKQVASRRNVFQKYKQALKDVPYIHFIDEPAGNYSNRWLTTLQMDVLLSPPQLQAIAEKGIETRPLWNPMHCQPAYVGKKAFLSGVAEGLFNTGLTLPSGNLSEREILEVVYCIENQLND